MLTKSKMLAWRFSNPVPAIQLIITRHVKGRWELVPCAKFMLCTLFTSTCERSFQSGNWKVTDFSTSRVSKETFLLKCEKTLFVIFCFPSSELDLTIKLYVTFLQDVEQELSALIRESFCNRKSYWILWKMGETWQHC